MKAIVDTAACVGCEVCVSVCPDVFVMDGAIAKTTVDTVPAAAEASAKEAATSCPVTAITFV